MTLIDRVGRLGGAERLAAQIAMNLDPNRFQRTLCVTRPDPTSLVEEASAAGVRVVTLERRFTGAVWAFAPLLGILRHQGVDVLHAHLFGSNVWGVVLGTAARVPVVIAHEHGWSFEGQSVRRMIDKHLIARYATLVLTASRHDLEHMIDVEGIPPCKVQYLPIGIDAPLAPGQRDVRAELGIPPDAPVVGAVCALRPEKALEVLLDAAVLIRSQVPSTQILIVGEGPEEARLRRQIDELGLTGAVRLLGRWPPSQIPDFLAGVDIAVNCSDHESSPLAVIEYMGAGKPVVATRVGGTPDLIQDGVHGRLVDRRNPRALADAIVQLLRDPAQRSAMGLRGRQRQQQEFDAHVMMERLEELYARLVSENSGRWRNA